MSKSIAIKGTRAGTIAGAVTGVIGGLMVMLVFLGFDFQLAVLEIVISGGSGAVCGAIIGGLVGFIAGMVSKTENIATIVGANIGGIIGAIAGVITGYIVLALLLMGLISGEIIPQKKKPVPCPQINEINLFSISTPNEMEMWLENNTRLTGDDILADSVAGTNTLTWQENGSTYYAYFDDNKIKSIHIHWKALEPTLNDVLDCLGTPDLYYAEFSYRRTGELHLSLWYLDEGFLVTSTDFGRQKVSVVIDENVIMTSIYFVATPFDSVEEMNEGLKPAVYLHYPLDVLKPWPDNLEDIVVVDLTQ